MMKKEMLKKTFPQNFHLSPPPFTFNQHQQQQLLSSFVAAAVDKMYEIERRTESEREKKKKKTR